MCIRDRVRFRSYDGYDYSDWTEVTIVADNPPDAGNSQPTFDSSDWDDEIILYCEINSQSQDRCTKAEIDLLQFFDDVDPGQELILSVYDNENSDTDDHHSIVVNVGSEGMAVYNPVTMFFYDTDMSTWTLEDVVFVATDTFGSKINSNPVTMTVEGILFTISPPEDSTVSEDGIAVFTGIGLPGKTVTVTIGGNTVNNTVVNSDSTWSLGVPASRIEGSATPVFKYGGDQFEGSKITVSGFGDSGMGFGSIIMIAIVALTVLGGLVYFFVEFEVDEDEMLEGTAEAHEDADESEEDHYAWAKEAEITGDDTEIQSESRLQKHDDHPGWRWDPDNQEWVPAPDHPQS